MLVGPLTLALIHCPFAWRHAVDDLRLDGAKYGENERENLLKKKKKKHLTKTYYELLIHVLCA